MVVKPTGLRDFRSPEPTGVKSIEEKELHRRLWGKKPRVIKSTHGATVKGQKLANVGTTRPNLLRAVRQGKQAVIRGTRNLIGAK